jgi:predicted metalloprotease with PDZ domain
VSLRTALLALWWGVTVAPTAAAQVPVRGYADGFVKKFSPTDPVVDYAVSVRGVDRSGFGVAVEIGNLSDSAVALSLPNWAPGAYRITNGWRRVHDLAATDAAGATLPVTKPDSLTWLVHTGAARTLLVRYTVAARDTANNRSYLRPAVGLIDGPSTFLYLAGHQNLPSHVRFDLPAGWRVGTGLMATPDSTVYFAPSYDVLIDSPILVGRFQRWVFTAAGTPHQVLVANDGRPAAFDTVAFVAMVRRIARTEIGIFGQAPYKDYSFIFVVGAGGGLEHLNSTTIGLNADRMAAGVTAASGVIAHEFFHTWNVKRIRPDILGPFDYTEPQRTLDLWFAEGNTSYYAALTNVRSGIIPPDTFRVQLQNLIGSHHANPARLLISPERSSWTTWDPPEVNGGYAISYYDQGELLGLLLDIAIRDSTDNRVNWDDVMRYLFAHYAGERGYASEDLLRAVNDVSGRDFEDFWRRYVSGTEEIPWNEYLARIGWRVAFRDSVVPVDLRASLTPPAAQLGVAGGSPYWRLVVTPGTAVADAGLVTGDEIVRIDGQDATAPQSFAPIRQLRPGGSVRLTVRREGQLRTFTLRGRPYTTSVATVTEVPDAAAKATTIRRSIMTGEN